MSKSPLAVVASEGPSTVPHEASLSIAVVSAHRQRLDDILQLLRATCGPAHISAAEGSIERLAIRPNRRIPDVLIVDNVQASNDEVVLGRIDSLAHLYPKMEFILLCQQQTEDFLLRAMRVGVREVLAFPFDAASIGDALDRIRRKSQAMPARQGKILAFISCKGGSGATFLAANAAHVLASRSNKKVALLDLNLQFGDALMFLSDQTPAATLADVARDIHRIDPAFLAASMVNVAPNLSVLAAPEDPAEGTEVKPEHIEKVLNIARTQYDFVVLDLSRNLDAQTVKALDHADAIHLVLQTTLPFIRDAKRLIEVFRGLGYPKSKVSLVVNRHQRNSDLTLPDLAQALGVSSIFTIPNHYESVTASVNEGIPVAMLSRTSPVSKALLELCAQYGPIKEASNRGPATWISSVKEKLRKAKIKHD